MRLIDAIRNHFHSVSSPFVVSKAPADDPVGVARWHNEQHDRVMAHFHEQNRLRDIWRSAFKFFWVAFFIVPLITNCTQYSFIAYRWFPDESFDAERHEMLASHEVCHGDPEQCGDMADIWKDKRTGKVFARAGFTEHRQREARRMMFAWFSYGLIGCLAAAAQMKLFDRSSFLRSLVFLIAVDAAIAAYTYYSIAG